MNSKLRSPCLIVLLTATATAGATAGNWSSGTAYTLPEGRSEKGLFQPLRHGQTDRVEWSVHPALFIKMPNFRVKIRHSSYSGWDVATRHSLLYPTPLLRMFRMKGFGIQALADMDVGGIISDDPTIPQIPHIISSRNEVMLTRSLGHSTFVTAKGGITIALRGGRLDSRTTVDLPVAHPRLGVYHNGYGVNLGLDFLAKVTRRVELLTDSDLMLLPGFDEGVFAFEHKGLLIWNKSPRFQVTVGYKLVFGEYPFGTQWHLLPLLDLQWGWQ